MATKDFSSKQIRVSQLLASGGISGTTAGMAIYSASNASNLEGGISDGAIFNNVGSDVFLFVSGTANITNSNRSNVTLFGGDVVVSGTIYAERQVIEVDETTTGSLLVSGSLFVSRSATINQGLNVNNSLSNVETNIFNRFGSAIKVSSGPFDEIVVNEEGSRTSFRVESDTKTHAVFVQGTTGQVLILSGGAPASPDELNYSDTAFFVSGSVGSKDTTTRGTSVFGGDVVISGSLHGGSPLQIGEYQPDIGTDVVLYVSGTTPAGGGGKGTPSGTTVLNSDLIVSGVYRGGYDPTAGIESFQAAAEQYLFLTSDADFSSPQIEATDSNFFFTGSIGSRGGGTPGTAVFGGDLHVSGAITADGGAPAPTYRYLYKDITNSAVQSGKNAFPFLNFRSDDDTDTYDTGGVVFSMPGSGSIERIVFTPASYNQDFSIANRNTFNSGDEAVIFIAKNERLNGSLYTTTNSQLPAMHCTSSDSNLLDFNFTNGNLTPVTNTIKKLFLDFSNNSPFISGSNQFDPGDTIMIGAYFKSRSTAGTAQQINVQIVFKIDESVTTYP